MAVPCAMFEVRPAAPPVTADIEIIVDYQNFLYHWLNWKPSEKRFHFATIRGSNGNMQWVPIPMGPKPEWISEPWWSGK